LNGAPQAKNGNEKVSSQNNQAVVSRILTNASTPSFHDLYASSNNDSSLVRRIHKCCAYIASESRYCQRLNSIQAFSDINRDVSLCC
jgi:translation initiation factor eIF-2B subunit gamma